MGYVSRCLARVSNVCFYMLLHLKSWAGVCCSASFVYCEQCDIFLLLAKGGDRLQSVPAKSRQMKAMMGIASDLRSNCTSSLIIIMAWALQAHPQSYICTGVLCSAQGARGLPEAGGRAVIFSICFVTSMCLLLFLLSYQQCVGGYVFLSGITEIVSGRSNLDQ